MLRRSGRTQTIGLLLPHLDQPYFLKLLAGIEQRLDQSDYLVLLGSAHWQHEGRQVELLQRMLARRADALVMAPRPAADLVEFVTTLSQPIGTPLVFIDNYLPETTVHSSTERQQRLIRPVVSWQSRDELESHFSGPNN